MSGTRPAGYDAHHIIPRAVHKTLEKMGSNINPHSPQYMTWWKRSGKNVGGTHQNFATKYNDEWREFLATDNLTDDDILQFARHQAEKYKSHYWKKKYYFELYQEVPMGSQSPYGYRSRQD